MKRLREESLPVRKEMTVLEIVVNEQWEDLALEIIGKTDTATLRRVAQTSRILNKWVIKWLECVRYFYGSWIYSDGINTGGGCSLLTTVTGKWPNSEKQRRALAEQYDRPISHFYLGAFMEIDQTDERSREFHYCAKDPGNYPLLPLAYARALVKRKKQAEFEAMLRAAAESGLLDTLLEHSRKIA
jgi:hypothetical protein